MKITLSQKILTGFIICVLILISIATFSFKNSEKFIETNKLVNHSKEILSEFEQLLGSTIDTESSARAFVITGKESFLEHYHISKTAIHEHNFKVKNLTLDNSIQQKNIELLQKQLELREKNLEEIINLRKKDFQKAKESVSSGKGKQIQDEIRIIIANCKNVENILLDERIKESEDSTKTFNALFILLLLIISVVLISLYLMISSDLRAFKRAGMESADKNWVLSGNLELNEKTRGEETEEELAQTVINQLCSYLNAQIGVIYLSGDGGLKLSGAYAFRFRKQNSNVIKPGEGLVGQVALEKKTIVFAEVPDDYISINSGLGNKIPKNIIVFPLLQNGVLKGVIEIGAARSFSALETEFLNMIGENIAIKINASQSRTKLKDFLEETQRQAAELKAQQEELKQSNEKLKDKTSLLEKSEAELKAQQEELKQSNEELKQSNEKLKDKTSLLEKSEAELKAQQEELKQSNEELLEKTGLLEKSGAELVVQQEELKQSNEELEEKANLLEEQKENLENAKVDIETQAQELKITSKYKSEFLANMSHELRTPLNSILILSHLLAENRSTLLGEKEIEFSKTIYKSGTNLLDLINEILDLSKIESGKTELEITEIPLSEINSDIISMFSELAISKSIDLSTKFNEIDLISITTDKQRLEQILRNLLSNALKFTDKGGKVTLLIDTLKEDVQFKNKNLCIVPDIIVFTVTDTGIGILPEKQEIIFEAFQQADGSSKRKYEGTGLGLSISRGIAGVLGGEIHLKSEIGKGSTFTLYLPLKFEPSIISYFEHDVILKERKSERFPKRNTSPPDTDNISKTNISDIFPVPDVEIDDDRHNINENDKVILILENDIEFSKVLLEFVRKRNYKCVIASQGDTGLSYARYYMPDAIILDMKLPLLDGVEVLKHLKNTPDLRHIPVQIISGYDKRREGMELGAFNFIQKPITMEDLKNTFDNIDDFINKKYKKLLIVEDNEKQNKAIRELVGNGDVKISSAYSGKESYEMMCNENFDCVIFDLGLPDMSGFDVLEKIKSNDNINKVPIIIYTGKDLSKDENLRLEKLSNSVVLKTSNSYEHLLKETMLFLHSVESKMPIEKQNIIIKPHKTDEVLKNKTVLVVDDDIRNIYAITSALEEEGMICLRAENGKDAIKLLNENSSVEIVLMDIMMPEMDGYEATKEIRSISKFEKLPIIALTAKAMKGDKEKCFEVGMTDYVSKPVNIDQLLSLMRVWLY